MHRRQACLLHGAGVRCMVRGLSRAKCSVGVLLLSSVLRACWLSGARRIVLAWLVQDCMCVSRLVVFVLVFVVLVAVVCP
jgi:hypothetical protein